MTRLCVLKVLKVIFNFWLKSNNMHNINTKNEMCHGKLPAVKYAPCTLRRSGNQMMMIKVRHTDRQHYARAKRAHSDYIKGIYCKKYQWGPKIRN